ncbi:hypothetical protein A9Q84_03985 [Halobacteriovorax marinus]|uniref:Uncharacterized protein n=1 Tax=Halobacteriovorax marinus TaxID=97084 RepID=A0A1Y5FFU1_9BACT|nr:hypothetical protein A9Q84_03985 [Halobacteriovorax marinus]
MQVNSDPRTGSSSFLQRPQREIQRCPQCESIFLDNNECESCGYQIGFDFLGDPLGEKSFYSIRESYWENLGPISKLHEDFESLDPKKFNRYKRKLLFRYNVLLDYLYDQTEFRLNDRNLYLQEFTDLIIELVRYGVSESELWQKIDSDSEDNHLHLMYQKIQAAIVLGNKEKEEASSFVLSLLNYKVFGFMRLGSIAVTFLGSFGIISAALSFYRYMIFNY